MYSMLSLYTVADNVQYVKSLYTVAEVLSCGIVNSFHTHSKQLEIEGTSEKAVNPVDM